MISPDTSSRMYKLTSECDTLPRRQIQSTYIYIIRGVIKPWLCVIFVGPYIAVVRGQVLQHCLALAGTRRCTEGEHYGRPRRLMKGWLTDILSAGQHWPKILWISLELNRWGMLIKVVCKYIINSLWPRDAWRHQAITWTNVDLSCAMAFTSEHFHKMC